MRAYYILLYDNICFHMITDIFEQLLYVQLAYMLNSFSCVQLQATLGLQPSSLLCPRDSPGKNTGVGFHAVLQGIFPTQGSNPCLLCLLHWQFFSTSTTWKAPQYLQLDLKPSRFHLGSGCKYEVSIGVQHTHQNLVSFEQVMPLRSQGCMQQQLMLVDQGRRSIPLDQAELVNGFTYSNRFCILNSMLASQPLLTTCLFLSTNMWLQIRPILNELERPKLHAL